MALKAKVESLDDVREEHQDLYTESDGQFVLDVQPVDGYALEEVDGMKKVLEEVKAERSELRDKVSQMDKELKSKSQSVSELKATQDEKAKEKIEELKKEMSELHQQEISEWQKKHDDLQSKYRKTRVHDELVRELGKAGPNGATKNGIDVLPRILSDKIELNENGDPYVVNEDGHARTGSGGKDMSISELVEETVDQYPEFFNPNGSSGGGSEGSGGKAGGTGITREQWESMSGEEKARATLTENGKPKKDFKIIGEE